MNLTFKPLSKENLDEAAELIKTVFPEYAEHVRNAYSVSIEDDRSNPYWNTRRLLKYWAATDPDSMKIVGLTGMYQLTKHDKDEVWLGWYCVDPALRGQGAGKRILEWTIAEARKRGYKIMRLWTSDDPDEAAAQKLYENMGLKIYKTEPDEKTAKTTLYREMKL